MIMNIAIEQVMTLLANGSAHQAIGSGVVTGLLADLRLAGQTASFAAAK